MIVRINANSTSDEPVPPGLTVLTGEEALWNDHKYSRGAQVFWQGEPAKYIYQVKDGAVRTCKLLSDGRRQIAAFYLPGDIFGIETDELHRFSAEAIIDTTVWIAKRHSMFEGLDNGDLAYTKSALELLQQTLQHVQNQLLLLGRQTALERVAYFLLEMDRRLKKPAVIILPMRRRDIADYLGLSLETVSRGLSVLRDNGIISVESQRRRVILTDRTKLAQIVCGNAPKLSHDAAASPGSPCVSRAVPTTKRTQADAHSSSTSSEGLMHINDVQCSKDRVSGLLT